MIVLDSVIQETQITGDGHRSFTISPLINCTLLVKEQSCPSPVPPVP